MVNSSKMPMPKTRPLWEIVGRHLAKTDPEGIRFFGGPNKGAGSVRCRLGLKVPL